MHTATCPRHLVLRGRGLNYTGPGRSPGSHVYVDPARGEVAELYFARIVSLGGRFGLAAVANNAQIPPVRVDHGLLNGAGPLQLGQVLLVGPLAFEPAGPRAEGAWPVVCGMPVRPAAVRKLGTVTAVKPSYGFLRPADGSPDLFFHFSQCHGFVPVVGTVVEFALADSPRGVQAANLRPR